MGTKQSPWQEVKELAGLFAAMVFVAAIGFVGWQCFEFLRGGAWPRHSVITGLAWAGASWAVSPMDWLGLHWLLQKIPLSLGLIVSSFAPLLLLDWLEAASTPHARPDCLGKDAKP